MYLFRATYIDCSIDKERARDITFDGQFLNSEKECYIYAMSRAYDEIQSNECLTSLELIFC